MTGVSASPGSADASAPSGSSGSSSTAASGSSTSASPSEERLHALLRAVRAERGAGGAQPAPEPAAGQSTADWLAEVAAARAAADAHALAHRARIDRLSQALFGQTVADLLPAVDVELTRTPLSVLAPGTPRVDGAPAGPGPRVAASALHDVPVTITAPPHPTAAVVRLHGGAFWMGGGEAGDLVDARLVDLLAATAGVAVFNVDYRLAPEHPFPAAIADTLAVLDAVRSGAGGFDIDPAAVVLVGTSSGANVAAVAAMAAAGGPASVPLAGLALIVPSVTVFETPGALRDDPEAWAVRQRQLRGYLGTAPGSAVAVDDPWVSPAVLPALPGMPPTFAAIAAHDEIATGGARLCEAIIAGGGTAAAREYVMTHTTAPPEVEAAFLTDVAAFVRDAVARATRA